ncbi:hypothetical protein KAR91_72935 [Candidatus Pacearchaeota archaeon]|nr:hypothetical protein [Candidatus Pacearchaeota archaeon]
MNDELQAKINKLFYALMKQARRDSFVDFLENWDLTEDDYEEIQEYFAGLGLNLGN